MPDVYDQFNSKMQSQGKQLRNAMVATGRGMGISHRVNSPSRGDSLSRLKDRYGFDNTGVLNRITIGNVNRSLIYTMAGAGKGIGGSKGSRWIDKYGNRKRTNPDSLGKVGSGKRRQKPFVQVVLDGPEGLEKIGDIAASTLGDAIVSNVFTK